jgi:large subunit ribosomal protein L32
LSFLLKTGNRLASRVVLSGAKDLIMANPKRRHSKARTATRRAHDYLVARSLSECPNCHEQKLPHRACPKCGYYKGREVLKIKEAE